MSLKERGAAARLRPAYWKARYEMEKAENFRLRAENAHLNLAVDAFVDYVDLESAFKGHDALREAMIGLTEYVVHQAD